MVIVSIQSSIYSFIVVGSNTLATFTNNMIQKSHIKPRLIIDIICPKNKKTAKTKNKKTTPISTKNKRKKRRKPSNSAFTPFLKLRKMLPNKK